MTLSIFSQSTTWMSAENDLARFTKQQPFIQRDAHVALAVSLLKHHQAGREEHSRPLDHE